MLTIIIIIILIIIIFKTAGNAAEIAVTRKEDRYNALSTNYDFIEIAN